MAKQHSTSSMGDKSSAVPFLTIGPEQTQVAIALQKDLLEGYERASRAWLARMQSEIALWSELAKKLSAARSFPESLGAYTKCVSQQMQMTAEDGQHLCNDCQEIAQKITDSLVNGRQS